jgi:PAS domain S-box-containing protein
MAQLKVILVGTSPAETLRLEEALQQSGYLDGFRYVGLEQALDRVPDWEEWDLLIARYQDRTGSTLLSLLAPVLRKCSPPILFLVDPFEPVLVNQLLNAGGRRVLPIELIEQVLEPAMSAVFGSNLSLDTSPAGTSLTSRTAVDGSLRSRDKFLVPEEGFARLFRFSPVGISINRLRDGKCVDCNESFARLLEWPREELIGRDVLELGLPADMRKLLEVDGSDGVERQSPVQFERKLYTRNRQIRHVQVHLDLIEWSGEQCVLSLVQDITEKEQAKEKIKRLNDELERLVWVRTGALHAANRELAAEIGRRKVLEDFSNQLSQIIWETPDVVAICAPDGRMQFLNKAGRALFRLGEDESVSHLDLFSAYPEKMRRWIREDVQPAVVRDGIWRGETEFQLSDGMVIPLSQVLLCKKDEKGEVQYFASIARDVSDFKNVERELRQSRERYRTLAEAAHDFIFMVSKDGRMEYANEYACQALGFDPDRVEGLLASQFFPIDFAANHLQMFNDVHEIDRPIYTEGPFVRDGEEAWLGTWLVPIHNGDGGLVSILGISRDITEQKKTDEALQRALQNERKLSEMRSNFFSMTSHQFRTPLSTILLSAELIQKYGQKWDESKRNEHLVRIQDAAKRLNSMLEDILVIGRVESGRYVCSPREFDLIPFIEQSILEISNNDLGEHELVFEHEKDKLPVYLDPEVLHRVVDNLLSNAIKYSPKGSQVITSVKIEDRFVLLEVTDQGIGIPDRDLQYLFQPFQRGSNAADIPGTGIGLTIIQKSVELLNGSVSIKSKEGQGTTFMVRLPARLESAVDRIFV